MFNWIVNDTYQYLEPFTCVQTNEYCWKELLVLNSNTWIAQSAGAVEYTDCTSAEG